MRHRSLPRSGSPRVRLAGGSLSKRLRDNESVLLSAYRSISVAVAEGRVITPAAEWLLDNSTSSRSRFARSGRTCRPATTASCRSSRPDPSRDIRECSGWRGRSSPTTTVDSNRRHCGASSVPISASSRSTIGELWAVAITLRIVLVENLRRTTQRIVSSRRARQDADAVADSLLGVNGRSADSDALARHHKEHSTPSSSFAVQLVKRLRDQDPKISSALSWLEARMVAAGQTSDGLVHAEHQSQGAANVTVRNIVTSMRLMSDVNWSEFFESVSLVDEVLCEGSDFASMDAASRNLYRNAIEVLARGSSLTELEIARSAIETARSGAERSGARSGIPSHRGGSARVRDDRSLPRPDLERASPLGDQGAGRRLHRRHPAHRRRSAVGSTGAAVRE